MYDDGLGGDNADCSSAHRSGCWSHRHDILWEFGSNDVLAMGAATARGPDGASYAFLLVGGFPADPSSDDAGYTPTYAYTWTQAVADGAGSNVYHAGVPAIGCKVPAVIGKSLGTAKRSLARRTAVSGP